MTCLFDKIEAQNCCRIKTSTTQLWHQPQEGMHLDKAETKVAICDGENSIYLPRHAMQQVMYPTWEIYALSHILSQKKRCFAMYQILRHLTQIEI